MKRFPAGGLARRKVAFFFLATIVIPAAFLSYIGIQSVKLRQGAIRESVKKRCASLASLLRTEMEKKIKEAEADGDAWIGKGAPGRDGSFPIEREAGPFSHEGSLAVSALLLDGDGNLLHPHREMPPFVPLSEGSAFLEALERARRLEFREGDPKKAIKNYRIAEESASSAREASIARIALGRCYVKRSNYPSALAAYRRTGETDEYLRAPSGVSLTLLARFQESLCLEEIGQRRRAVENTIRLLEALSRGELSDVADEVEYYFDAGKGKILEWSPPDESPFLSDAWKRLEGEMTARRAGWKTALRHRDAFLMKLKEGGAAPRKPAGEKDWYSLLLPAEAVLFLWRPLEGESVEKGGGLLILEIPLSSLRDCAADAIRRIQSLEKYATLNIVDASGRSFPEEESGVRGLAVQEPLLADLPGWKVRAAYRETGPLFSLYRRQRNIQVALIALFLFVIGTGIFVTLRSVRKELQLARLRSDFVSSVSHELRTPLTTIRMLGEMLEMGAVPSQEKAREYYATIKSESERLTRLINNVLDFSKMEVGKKEYRFVRADLGQTVSNTIRAFQCYVHHEGFRFVTKIDPHIPIVNIDEDAVSQALLNLLNNAVKYSREEKTIWVRLRREGDEALLEVDDRGVGIPEKDLPHIFEKFYRVSRGSEHVVKGVGLGLTIVQHIAAAHGGRAGARSREGEGSTFWITLPIGKKSPQ